MATHEIKADLDVDGEVQGTSLDINGNADIAGNLNMSNHTLTANLVESSEFRLDTLGDAITFYGGGQLQHSIMARDASGTAADDLRINSYGAVYVNLDSNNNNTSAADFVIGNHGDATGTINTLFTLSGEDGDATFTGTIGSGAITSTGKITGTELEGTSLDINGAADISGTLTLGGDVTIINSIIHAGDTDTYFGFHNANEWRVVTGGTERFEITNSGATFAGNIAVGGTVDGVDIATRDGILSGTTITANSALPKAGGTMAGPIAMGSQNITGAGTITGTTLTGTSLDINGNADISGTLNIHDEIITTAGGSLLEIYRSDWTTASNHDVLYQSWNTNTDDFIYLKSPGNSTTNHGIAFIGDNVIAFGRTQTETGNPELTSAAAPLNDNWLVLNTTGATFAGTINSGAITSTGQITGTELEGTSLDINGNADISGNLTGVDTLTATTLSVTNYGLASADIPNNAADTSGNADTADTALEATNVTATANNSANETVYPTFVDGPSGAQGIETDTGLHYNPSSGMLTAAGFTGALTGNASGSSGSCTGNAATATLAATSTIASDTGSATHFPVFVDGSTGSRALKAHSSWNYNPGTSTLTAGKLTTDVAAIVEDNKSNSALMTLTGQGAGDEGNVSLKMLGTSAGNPIKLKMAGLDDSGSQVGAGFLSYDAEDDSFGVGQSSSHNRMGVKIETTISLSSPDVHYEPVSIKAREFVATSNSTHYDFYGDIIRNGNDTTTRGKLYVYKNGTWTITNADTKLDANGLLGLAIGTNSTTHGMLLRGTFTLDYDPGGNGNPLYISTTDGVMSTTVPSTSGHIVRLVGYLLGGTHGNMFFDPDKTYIEVA